MAKNQKSLSFVQVAAQYRLTKATNTLDFQIGKLYEKSELQKVIDSGIQVTVTNNK